MIILIQIIGSIKPSPHLHNPTRYFIFNFLMISFIFIDNKCFFLMRYEIWKGRKKGSAKGWFEPASRFLQKAHVLSSTPLKHDLLALFFSVDYPNHTLVGGVSVNSLSQQGGIENCLFKDVDEKERERNNLFYIYWEICICIAWGKSSFHNFDSLIGGTLW